MQPAPLSNIAEYTVSELSSAIKQTVEDAYGLVRLRGEISGYRGPHSSGHVYLALKDDRAKIDAVIWRGTFSCLKFKPEEGLEVIVTGRVTTFPGKSSYQIVIEQLEPAGAGALMALLEERKKKFAAEGLFDDAHKRPLPFWPQVIGIVTSPTGAVIRDMLHGFTERCPAHVIVWPVRVQGETCGAEVAAAISGFNALPQAGRIPRPELLIVARGGGSLEDLWGFNEEAVVRAAAASKIPLISAVGHETDWTLIDLVADARAPTPTKAAEWAVPRHSDLVLRLSECIDRARRCVRLHLDRRRADFRGIERSFPRPASLLAIPRQRLDTSSIRLAHSLRQFSQQARARFERSNVRLAPRLISGRVQRCQDHLSAMGRQLAVAVLQTVQRKQMRFVDRSERLHPQLLLRPLNEKRQRLRNFAERATQCEVSLMKRTRNQLDGLAQLLRALSHKSVLERGFALVRGENGRMIRRAQAMPEGNSMLEIEFADGRVTSHYRRQPRDGVPEKIALQTAAVKRTVAMKKDDGTQGSLL